MLRRLKYLLLVIVLLGLAACALAYFAIFSPNFYQDGNDTVELYVESGSSYQDVFSKLQSRGLLKNETTFDLVARMMNYKKEDVPSGFYNIRNNLNNRDLIAILRSGDQTPVKMTLNNCRLLTDLSSKLSRYTELDSSFVYEKLTDELFLDSLGYTRDNIMTLFVPNSYEIWWNSSFEDLIARMQREHKKYWNQDRLKQCEKLKMTPTQVYTLASIVEKETIVQDERATVAGLYHNRLERGIRLQADPTVVFASGIFDLRRVLNRHLEIDSPYNTYLNDGLPPGPICMPSLSSIEATLHPEDHNYLYMCAYPDNSGRHAFASTLSQHNNNAIKYRRYLNKLGIR